MTDHCIDLNSDMGEGAGADAGIMPFVSSVSIACGAHAGSPDVMRATVRLALEQGVAIGAHPGFPDRQGFGRRPMSMTPAEISTTVFGQIGFLYEIVTAEGGVLRHVKPHGALYNMAATDPTVADAVAGAVRGFNPALKLIGLAGGELLAAGRRAGLAVAAEAFADRSYRADGTLAPRDTPGAVLSDPAQAAAQALDIVTRHRVRPAQGGAISLRADSICIHGDSPGAPAIARAVHDALRDAGIIIRPVFA